MNLRPIDGIYLYRRFDHRTPAAERCFVLFRLTGEADMPPYFFDIRDAEGFHRDTIGTDLDSFDEARQQAQALLPDLMREQLPDGEYHLIVCDVRDGEDRTVYRGEISYRGTRFPIFGLPRTSLPPDNIDSPDASVPPSVTRSRF